MGNRKTYTDERQRERRRRRRIQEIKRNLILTGCLFIVIGGAVFGLSRLNLFANEKHFAEPENGNAAQIVMGENTIFTETGSETEVADGADGGSLDGVSGSGTENAEMGNAGAGSGTGSAEEGNAGAGSGTGSAEEGDAGAGSGTGSAEEGNAETGGAARSDENGWQLILVNQNNSLPENYDVELTELTNGQMVDSRIYPALQEMFDDARKEGVYPIVASGYRTAEKQQSLMDEKVQEYLNQGYSSEEAAGEAKNWVAMPGYSEHQLGSAVDINADGIYSGGDQVYSWLNENSWRYGFIQRYPENKTDITGIAYEPWHYRYVGREAAEEIYTQGICLEEYLGAN